MVCFEIYTFRNEIKFETVFLYLFWLSRSIFSFFLPRFGFVLLSFAKLLLKVSYFGSVIYYVAKLSFC